VLGFGLAAAGERGADGGGDFVDGGDGAAGEGEPDGRGPVGGEHQEPQAVPVSRTAENGASAGTDTVTGFERRTDRRCSSHDPLGGSSTGRPSQVARTGTFPATHVRPAGVPGTVSLTVAAAARASAVLASSGREGPGSTSKSMDLLD
jgi:hypothetical protein